MELSVITLGHVDPDAFGPLALYLTRIEQVITNLTPHAVFAGARAELNRAIDAAANDWILILRERERIDEALASEIVQAMDTAGAWGFRLRVQVMYAGKPLRLAGSAGELRLVHRRHLLRRGDLAVQGTVIRLRNPLRTRSFESADAHREYLRERAVPHSTLRRTLIFLRNARTFDPNTLRYLWIEAGFDHESQDVRMSG